MADSSNYQPTQIAVFGIVVGLALLLFAWKSLYWQPESPEGGILYQAELLSSDEACKTVGRISTCDSDAWVTFMHEGRITRARIAPFRGNRNAKIVAIVYKPEFQRAVLIDIVPNWRDWFLASFIALHGLWLLAVGYLLCVRDPQHDFLARHLTRMFPWLSRHVKHVRDHS